METLFNYKDLLYLFDKDLITGVEGPSSVIVERVLEITWEVTVRINVRKGGRWGKSVKVRRRSQKGKKKKIMFR